MTKSSVTPIQCLDMVNAKIQEHLPCRVENYPIKYLGLLLSIYKPQLQPLIDYMADHLPSWKAD
jgi:hypothetical protein